MDPQLTIGDIVRVANGEAQVEISPGAIERITRARIFVYQQIGKDEPLYGFNCGVGLNKDRSVQEERFEAYNRSLISSHSISVKPEATRQVVRAAMLI